MFLISEKKNEDKENQTKIVGNNEIKESKSEKIDSKISKIKSVFTPEILSKNSDIADKLKVLDSLDNPLEKEKVLKYILELLKKP
jgi:ketopantoate reductase